MSAETTNYLLRVGHVERSLDSAADLASVLNGYRDGREEEIWVLQRRPALTGAQRLVYRALGLSKEQQGPGVCLVVNQAGAALIFVDEDWREARVVNPSFSGDREHRVSFILASGDVSYHHADEIVPTDTAIKAVMEFFERGERPAWLVYR